VEKSTVLPGAFTRASSGLVRQVRTRDVFWFGWQTIALSYIVFLVISWVYYPGASMEIATVIAIVGGVAIGGCYALLAAVYPRSGAEYVFLSRSLHPMVGFALSFNFAFWQIFYIGLNAAFFCLFALQPTLAAIGIQTGNPSVISAGHWLGSPIGIFLVGGALIVALMVMHLRGAGRYFKWQRIGSYLALGSLAVTVAVLALAAFGVLSFESNFNAVAGPDAYSKVISDATAAGLNIDPAFSLSETLKFVLWPAFSLWFVITAVSFSGEVKNVQRSQLTGMVGAVIVMGATFVLMTSLYRGAFGEQFLRASTNGTPLEADPFTPLFTAIAGGNIALTIVMSLWVLTISFFVAGSVFVYPSRTMLAWSLDGMAPRQLGAVNKRYNSPHVTLVICAVIGIIVLGLFCFTDLLGVVSGFLGLAVNFLVVCAWAVLFPFVRKETFENSPIAWRVGRVPVISILGAISTLLILPIMYLLVTDTTFSVNLGFMVWGAVGSLAVGVVWYLVQKAASKRNGVDVEKQYAEIPVE
jgi:amino acid transporter